MITLLSMGVHAQNAVLEDQLKNNKNKLGLNLTMTHADGFSEDIDSSTTLSAIGTMKLSGAWSLTARQRLTKVYVYDKFGGREFTWDDFRLGIRYRFLTPPSFLSSVSSDMFFFVPSSEFSQDVGRKGRVFGRFTFIRTFEKGLITLGYQPYGLYNFNRYKQNQEGAVNQMGILGNNIFVSIAPIEKLSFTGLVGFGQTYDELGEFQQDGRASNEGFIDIDVSATYTFTPKWFGTVGYAHSESQVKGGTFEFYAFDPEVSSWYLQSGYRF